MEAIVGLLNDRAEVDDSPDSKIVTVGRKNILRNEYLISTCITSVDLLANPSELEVLRQRNSELEAKNVELEAKIVELEKWRQRAILNEEKIDEPNAENAVLVDEIFELKSENAKLRNPEARYYSMSLSNIRNLAYSILEKLGDDIVNDEDFTEQGTCSQ